MSLNKYFAYEWSSAFGDLDLIIVEATGKGDLWKKLLRRHSHFDGINYYISNYYFDLENKNIKLLLHDDTVEWVFDPNNEKNKYGHHRWVSRIRNVIDEFITEHDDILTLENRYEWTYKNFGKLYERFITKLRHSMDDDVVYVNNWVIIKIDNDEKRDYLTYTYDHDDDRLMFQSEDFNFTQDDQTTPDDNGFGAISYKLSSIQVVN